MVHPFLQVQNMTGKLRFEVNDNQGCFIFPETWFGSLLDEFEELIDAYDADEISETSYINKLRRLARQENDFIDVHAHLAYVFLEQNAPRKALNAALKGLAVGNRLIPEGFSGRIIWIHPDNRPFLRALYAAILANRHINLHFWQKVDAILGAAVELRVTFLTAKSFDFSDRQALNADGRQSFTHVFQFEWFDYHGNQLHKSPPVSIR